MRLVVLQSFAIVMLLVNTSCSNKKKTDLQVDSTIAIPYPQEFYNVKNYNNEISDLVSEIRPGKDYHYWSYIGKTTIERGNTKLKKLINQDSINIIKPDSGVMLVGIKNRNVEYYSFESISKFLGEIDNVTEAFIIAKSYGYSAHEAWGSSHYRVVDDKYVLTLSPEEPFSQNIITEVTVTKKGFLKSRTVKVFK